MIEWVAAVLQVPPHIAQFMVVNAITSGFIASSVIAFRRQKMKTRAKKKDNASGFGRFGESEQFVSGPVFRSKE